MTNISFNLSEKIDPVILDILQVIHQEASARLVQDMAGSARTHDRSDEILAKITRLKQGFLETGV